MIIALKMSFSREYDSPSEGMEEEKPDWKSAVSWLKKSMSSYYGCRMGMRSETIVLFHLKNSLHAHRNLNAKNHALRII